MLSHRWKNRVMSDICVYAMFEVTDPQGMPGMLRHTLETSCATVYLLIRSTNYMQNFLARAALNRVCGLVKQIGDLSWSISTATDWSHTDPTKSDYRTTAILQWRRSVSPSQEEPQTPDWNWGLWPARHEVFWTPARRFPQLRDIEN
jgi:hypothetical protein